MKLVFTDSVQCGVKGWQEKAERERKKERVGTEP